MPLVKELSQSKIEYSMDELKDWIETGKLDPSGMLKFSGLFCFSTLITSVIYYVNPTQILMLVAIFGGWFFVSVVLPEQLQYYFINKRKLKKICQDPHIEY